MTLTASISASLSRAIGDYFRASLDQEPSGISLSAPETDEERRRREAMAAKPIPGIDVPLPVVQSFSEHIDAIVLAMDEGLSHYDNGPNISVMVETLVFDRVSGYTGRLYSDPVTGRDVALVTPEGVLVVL